MFTEKLCNVRIVKLPAMTVASYSAESKTPESDCLKVISKFVLENNLHNRSGYRFFGFNDPCPEGDNPVYIYQMWVTIPEDFNVPKPLIKKQVSGGLYASISAQMNEIGERWELIVDWCKKSDEYIIDSSNQGLEEYCMEFETYISMKAEDAFKQQLDLLVPVKRK